MPINDDTIKILKKAIADAFNAQLSKTLKGKARKNPLKEIIKWEMIWGML